MQNSIATSENLRTMSDRLQVVRLGALLLLAVAVATPVRADNVLRVGYTEGAPNDSDLHVIITASNDEPIHAFSLALTFPSEALALTEFGVSGTDVIGLEPDWVQPDVDNSLGVATLAVVFEFNSSVADKSLDPLPEGAAPRILARLTFRVRGNAVGGEYPIRLIDGIGSPASFNRFVSGQQGITPTMIDGALRVHSGDVLSLESARAICGATPGVTLTCRGKHSGDLQGFQVGVSYDTDLAEVIAVTYDGTDVGRQLGNAGRIEFFITETLTDRGPLGGRSRTGVIFDYVEPFFEDQILPAADQPDEGHSLLRFRVRARSGIDCGTVKVIPLLLENLDLGGSVNNAFIVDGASIVPRLVHGSIYFATGHLQGRVVDAVTGEPLRFVRAQLDPTGWSATTDGNGAFRFNDLPPGTYTVALSWPEYYTERITEIFVDGDTTTDAGVTALYEIPPTPLLHNPYRRGDVNQDGRTGLSDAIRIFTYLFAGTAAPNCLAAADASGDFNIDITDGISLLQYLFNGGTPPGEPFMECGDEPGEDERLGCTQFTPCS